jgi:dipeptidyl aminopeptidase/acylaminoacyl peptidase
MLPIEQKDILSYRFLSGLRFAPGGGKAAFVVANANEEENCYERRLWLYEHHAIRQLTDLGKESGFVWLDENRLLFPAVRSAKEKKRAEAKEEFTAYYVLDVRGGEALPFMTLPMQVSTLRVLDETHFLVTADVDKRHPDLWNADEETRKKVRAEREADADYEVFDELPFWGNGQGVTNGSRSSLFLVGLEPFRVTAVTAPPEVQGIVCASLEMITDKPPEPAEPGVPGSPWAPSYSLVMVIVS